MKSKAIITASDRRYGDFLIEHWLRSLRDNADLSDVDVCVLDYGLSEAQRFFLEAHGVVVEPCRRDGHVVVVRYRDMERLLESRPQYRQACLCDSGDIVFQGNVSAVFDMAPDSFRAVCEDYKTMFSLFITPRFFSAEDRRRLTDAFMAKPMINGGFVVGSREGMLELARAVDSMIKDPTSYGPDQLIVTWLLHERGFVSLDPIYNYVIPTAKEGLAIKDGRFYTGAGREPVVVHNAGNVGVLRPVKEFGYGKGKEVVLKEDLYAALRALYVSADGFFRTQGTLREHRLRVAGMFAKMRRDLRMPAKAGREGGLPLSRRPRAAGPRAAEPRGPRPRGREEPER